MTQETPLIALELSDAGILAARSGTADLLEVDDGSQESPGVVVPEKKTFHVGQAASAVAHLYPRLVINRFWDRLDTEPLKQPLHFAGNHAEIAFVHLERIWRKVGSPETAMIAAVPGFMNRRQMGIILGIARELEIPLQGFIALPVAAASRSIPEDGRMLHLDLHLHRTEISLLAAGERLSLQETFTLEEKGIAHLYRILVETIAREFVRSTRFDPLHQAQSEQQLFDRLPALLGEFQARSSVAFDLRSGGGIQHVTVKRALLREALASYLTELQNAAQNLCRREGMAARPLTLQLTHRMQVLPGVHRSLRSVAETELVNLEPGAGARGALAAWSRLAGEIGKEGIAYFSSRPRRTGHWTKKTKAGKADEELPRPTHLLIGSVAYPIGESPIVIGTDPPADARFIRVPEGDGSSVAGRHCSVQREGNQTVLVNHSPLGTRVDMTVVRDHATLRTGQVIRFGSSGFAIQLIVCLELNAT
jgi:hypothetical protein